MKTVLLFLNLLLSISLFAQAVSPCGNARKRANPKKFANLYDEIYYDEQINTYVLSKDYFTPFTGTAQTWNRSGFVLSEITCIDGKRDGIDTAYYVSGCIKEIKSHILGTVHGTQQSFYDSTGQLKKEENYANGRLNGVIKEFNRAGDTLLYMNFKNDVRDGIQREYFLNTKPASIISYKNGLLDGMHLTFNEEGKLLVRLNYKEGKRNGKCVYYHNNGKEAGIENWTMEQKDGDFMTYNDEGILLYKSTFKKDIPVGEHIENDAKGKLIHQTIYDKKGVKQYEMEIDEYGDKKVLFDISKSDKTTAIQEDDDPNNIIPKDTKKNKHHA